MANQQIMGALIARNAALSAGAPPAEASRAAIVATIFPNPIMGAVIGRALAKKGDVAKPGQGGGGGGGGQLPAPADQPLAGAVDELADSIGVLAGSIDKSAAAIDALAKGGVFQQSAPTRSIVEKAGAGSSSQAVSKKT